jgi:hypothetical protein
MDTDDKDTRALKMSTDSEFKKLVRDKYILSMILMGCVEEFRDMDMDQTISCLDVMEGMDIVKTRDTEFISGTGEKVFMDSVFEVKLPNDDVIGIMVNIEGQGNMNTGYPLLNRATYYASQLIVDQKGKEFSGSDYGMMKKVVSIWCLPNPPAAMRNTAVEYRMSGGYIKRLSSTEPIDEYDPIRIIMINLGDHSPKPDSTETATESDRYDTMVKTLSIIFDEIMGLNEKKRSIKEDYMFPLSDYALKAIEGLNMTLTAEDFWQGRADVAREEGMMAGEKIGLDKGRKEANIRNVRNLVEKMGISVEEAIELIDVPEDIREDVMRSVRCNE